MRKAYRGRDIEVTFDLDICVHIGDCLRGHRQVFQLNRRPWILPDLAGVDEVAEVVRLCPRGALLYNRLDGGPQEDPDGPITVTPIRHKTFCDNQHLAIPFRIHLSSPSPKGQADEQS